MPAYYNEIDPYAAQWLRNLIDAGHIASGDVDERSIRDLKPDELRGYTQAHFFAGIGGWSVALRLAGWSDDRPVWTGSCPCQPFSAAGTGKAADDERHLWPAWFPLIAECRPPVVFGEQVEAAIGWGWLDAVFADLEEEGYACGASVLPACGVGAPHIRNRTWFVADTSSAGTGRNAGDAQRSAPKGNSPRSEDRGEFAGRAIPHGSTSVLAHANGGDTSTEGLQRGGEHGQRAQDRRAGDMAHSAGGGFGEQRDAAQPRSGGHADRGLVLGVLADADIELGRRQQQFSGGQGAGAWQQPGGGRPWGNLEWLPCTDGKARPVESGSFPLAHGVQRRTSKLRAYGNAIVPQVAAEFIRAATLTPNR